MKDKNKNDPFLQKRVKRYDKWLAENKISYSSKVIPVSESLASKQRVLPTEQAIEILRKAKSVAVQNCECRSHYKRCNNPLETCFLLDEVADKFVSRGEARYLSFEEAAEILKNANTHDLIHLCLYIPDHKIYALCSCCSCCCHELQIIKKYNRPDLMVYSEYHAFTDSELCIHCGDCIERCMFGARKLIAGHLISWKDVCAGCGLCVTVCKAEAISMNRRHEECP